MQNQPISARFSHLRCALLGPLAVVLALGAAGAHAQTVTPTVVATPPKKPLPTDVTYYVDGKLAAPDVISTMNPSDIGSINVLKGKQAQELTGKATGSGAVLVTTKGKENSPEVLAFNKAHNVVLHAASPAQTAGMAAAQAYVEKTYPNAKLTEVFEDKKWAGHFVARFEEGDQTKELHFDGQGQPVAE